MGTEAMNTAQVEPHQDPNKTSEKTNRTVGPRRLESVIALYTVILFIIKLFPIQTAVLTLNITNVFSDFPHLSGLVDYNFQSPYPKLMTLIAIMVFASHKFQQRLANTLRRFSPKPTYFGTTPAVLVFVPGIFLVLFVLFQTTKPIMFNGIFERLLDQNQAFVASNPLSTCLNYLEYTTLKRLGSPIDPFSFIAYTSNFAGYFFVLFLAMLSLTLFKSTAERITFFAFTATQGFMIIFFGAHAVNPQQIAVLPVFLLLSFLYLERRISVLLPAISFGIALLMHFSTGIFIIPFLALPLLRETSNYQHITPKFLDSLLTKESAKLLVGFLLTVGLFFAFFVLPNQSALHGPLWGDLFGGGDGGMFVPFFSTSKLYENYTMFSTAHFLDKLNLFLLLTPLGLLLWLIFPLTQYRQFDKQKFLTFLFANSLFGFLFVISWNPDFGAILDYNLFSPAVFMMTVFVAYVLATNLRTKEYKYTALLATTGSLLHLVPLILVSA